MHTAAIPCTPEAAKYVGVPSLTARHKHVVKNRAQHNLCYVVSSLTGLILIWLGQREYEMLKTTPGRTAGSNSLQSRCKCSNWLPCSNSRRVPATGLFPQVLLVHEQYPQSHSGDQRLLALVSLLQAERKQVSLLYRRHVPAREQMPRVADLAARLGIRRFSDAELNDGSCLRAPPAIYRFSGRALQIARLAETGWFDMIFITVWFGNEPPLAELALPLLRAHSPRFAYIGLLVDVRAASLVQWETDNRTRREYQAQADSRLVAMYRQADAILHLSSEDQREEQKMYAGLLPDHLRWLLLRTPLRALRLSRSPLAARAHRVPPRGVPPSLGFVGNATNFPAVAWFLTNVWGQLREVLPQLRLRLAGRIPGSRSNSSGVFGCHRGARTRCGWAWGTRYAGIEAANGIDELGSISNDAVVREALNWRAMVSPNRATTRVNTKLIAAFELGIPLIATSESAAPLLLDSQPATEANLTPPIIIADEAAAFVHAAHRLVSDDSAWRSASRAAIEAFVRMERADPAASDMQALLRTARARLARTLLDGADVQNAWQKLNVSTAAQLCNIVDPIAACKLSAATV
jgi:hypothetical protein